MRHYHLIYVAAALVTVACSQDNVLNNDDAANSRLVTFSVEEQPVMSVTRATSDAPEPLPLKGEGKQLWLMPSVTPTVTEATVTRGTPLNSVTDLSNFGVTAFKHTAIPDGKTLNEYLADNHMKPDFFCNLEATKVEGTERFTLDKDYYWPATNEILSFFAYAPYGDAKVTPSNANAEGPQTIRLQINTDVKQQADLITAQASSTAHTDAHSVPSVRLNFSHQLTAIRFVVGKQFLSGYVKSIALKNVYTEGTYTIGGSWTLSDENKGNFTINYNLDKPVDGTKDEVVTAADETFFMIPHEFDSEDDAEIEVVYNDGYTDYTVSASLAGTTWAAGTTVTYAITSNKLTTLQIASIDYPATPTAASGMPDEAKSWQDGAQVGMYVVAADGVTLKHKNIPVTYDAETGKWNINHTTADGTIYRLPGETFYFYYPYSTASNNQPTGYPEQCPEQNADAETFFEGVVNNFQVATDQSVLDDFLACNLMIAKATDEGHASTIKATMERQVGIAVISIAQSKTIPENIVYTNGVETSRTGSYTIATTDKFASNTPYQNSNKFYYFTKVGGTTSFSSKAGEKYYWNAALTFNLGKNAAEEKTAQTDVEWNWVVKEKIIWQFTKTNANTAASIYTWAVPYNAKYKFECWGAQGGNGVCNGSAYDGETSHGGAGGKGGYAKGDINLTVPTSLKVYVGGKGADANYILGKGGDAAGGWNGGGKGIFDDDDDDAGGGGGGATDIRIIDGSWNSFASLKSRIMVAGGGGGSSYWVWGGSGGGLEGSYPTQWTEDTKQWESVTSYNYAIGTQTSGYKFGIGEDASHRGAVNTDVAGAGGGYYGGKTPATLVKGNSIGGCGGSGFVSGMTGCNAIAESSTSNNITHTDSPNHYSGLVFTNTQMIDGGHTQPKPIGGTETGHSGNGYARITYDQQDQ